MATPTTSTSTASLELTPTHFVLTAKPKSNKVDTGGTTTVVTKRAGDVSVGDTMWALSSTHQQTQQLHQYKVYAIEATTMQGLYNPYTLGGTIIVDGVVASSHSWWFADAAADALGLPTSVLPALYQAVLAPARALWYALGPQAYVEMYERLDGQLDFANLLSSSSGMILAAARLAGVLALAYLEVMVKGLGAWLISPAAGAALFVGIMAVINRRAGKGKAKLA
jgi:hypothetical protein